MSSYRFCRTDDIGLLVDALNRCWAPHFPGEAPMTETAFKRSIRDLQVWCSSSMVAFSGPDPIGVLIGAKRSTRTLVQKIAVHPDHLRQGHARHLLTSLASKLAILGPPRIVAEVPEPFAAACALFDACGYAEEARLSDYVLHVGAHAAANAEGGQMYQGGAGTFVIPVSVDDLAANGLLDQAHPQSCWERSVETLTARKEQIRGIAVASDERIQAYALAVPGAGTTEVLALRSFVEDGGARLKQLVARLVPPGQTALRFPKVHPSEIARELLEACGFHPAGTHRLYHTRAVSA